MQGVLEDIRRKKLKVVPQCPFVATYIRRHPEWMDLVLTAETSRPGQVRPPTTACPQGAPRRETGLFSKGPILPPPDRHLPAQ